MPRRRAKARPARSTRQRTQRFFESLGTRRGRRSSAPRGKHRRSNLQPATATGPPETMACGQQHTASGPLSNSTGTGARRRCSSVRLSNHPGLISLVAYAGCPVARECLVVQVEFHSVSGVSTRGPLDHNTSPQTTCVFVRALCYARTPRKTNIIVFMYKTK